MLDLWVCPKCLMVGLVPDYPGVLQKFDIQLRAIM